MKAGRNHRVVMSAAPLALIAASKDASSEALLSAVPREGQLSGMTSSADEASGGARQVPFGASVPVRNFVCVAWMLLAMMLCPAHEISGTFN